jgi:hypothetical protein
MSVLRPPFEALYSDALHFRALRIRALSDGAATGLIIAIGAGGSLLLVLVATIVSVRRSARKTSRDREMARVGGGKADDGQDAFPPQPYSPDEPRSHRPYSKPYQIPRQDHGRASTNGHRPAESSGTGVPTTPWPPTNDEDSAAGQGG